MTKNEMINRLVKMLKDSDWDYVESVYKALIQEDINSVEKMLGYEMIEAFIDLYNED